MKLIVGLGNPGKSYENTRHNIGFMIIDNYLNNNAWLNNETTTITPSTIKERITNYHQSLTWQTKFNAKYTTITIEEEKVLFLKPQTYMNLSGTSIRSFIDYFKINLQDILVIHDDLDLPCGTYRIKINSSDGGHNGVKSIISSLGTNAFARLKIGISKSDTKNTKDYVLERFNNDELKILENNSNIYNQIINDFLKKDITKLMNDYNRKNE